jgi:hypothetical protein
MLVLELTARLKSFGDREDASGICSITFSTLLVLSFKFGVKCDGTGAE